MKKEKTLCKIAQEKNIGELKKLAENAKYICSGCFRVSNDPHRICCKPEPLSEKKLFGEIITKMDEK